MDKRPKMSGSDKSKKREDIFEAFAAKGIRLPSSASCAMTNISWSCEHHHSSLINSSAVIF
jgi:hypothetical protein